MLTPPLRVTSLMLAPFSARTHPESAALELPLATARAEIVGPFDRNRPDSKAGCGWLMFTATYSFIPAWLPESGGYSTLTAVLPLPFTKPYLAAMLSASVVNCEDETVPPRCNVIARFAPAVAAAASAALCILRFV